MQKELMAIFYTDRNGLEHKVCSVTCLKKVFLYNLSLHNTLDVEEYLARQRELGQLESYSTVYGSEGMPEDTMGCERTFGKVCEHCHDTLAAWYVCKHCEIVQWFDDCHTCSAFPLADEDDYEDDYEDDNWQLTEFEYDQL